MTFSRREFLKAGLAGSLAVGAGGLLSACGTGNTIKPFTTSIVGKPRTGGQLRAGLTGGSTADTLSPLNAITNVDFSRINNLYEPLIGLTPEALPVNVLAEELTSNAKATEWTVRVKQGITFHNGKPLTADDVIYTFQQILNPKAPAAAAAGLASIDAKGMTKLDAYTVRIPCKHAVRHPAPGPGHTRLLGHHPGRLQPGGPGRHRPVQGQELQPGHAVDLRPLRRLLAVRDAVAGRDRHHRLRRPDQPGERAAGRAGRRGQPAERGRDLRGPGREQERPALGGRRLEPVHHAGGPGALQRRARPPGHAAGRRPPADARPGLRRLRDAGQRPVRDLGAGVRPQPAAAAPGHRPGQVAAQGGGRRRTCTSRWSPPTSRRAPCWPRRCSPSRRRRPGSR